MLKELHIELNIPPFSHDKQQLIAEKVEDGRKIAAVRIHVERAIGRMNVVYSYIVCTCNCIIGEHLYGLLVSINR